MRRWNILMMAVVCLLGLLGPGTRTVQAAARPEYLKSVTYFGDEWPINYWGSEDKDMDANFERIVADGFNSIILVIPWREFHPNTVSEVFNEAAFSRLNQVMDCAEKHGLWVSLRIGYLWDYYGESEVPPRYAELTKRGSSARNAWLEYCQRLYQTASSYSNFHSGFITWEDLWDYIYNLDRDLSKAERQKMAGECGYTEFLSSRYSLEAVQDWYGVQFSNFGEVYLPYGTHPSAALFYEYYDQFLLELLHESQTVFPGLSLEIRADGDVVYDASGGFSYYSHAATYACGSAPYSALMYSVSMGQENTGNYISADTALQAMRTNLERMYARSGKRFFVEQLLYMDSTEAFSHNTQIEDAQVGDFVRRLAPVLTERTMGYGLWVYRNYVNNCVYNGQFGLGETGWDFTGTSEVVERNGTRMASVSPSGSISQRLTGRLSDGDKIYVSLHGETSGAVYVKVEIGNVDKNIHVVGSGDFVVEFPFQGRYDIRIRADRQAYVDDIRVFTYEQKGRIYDRSGNELDLAEDFRTLNRELP